MLSYKANISFGGYMDNIKVNTNSVSYDIFMARGIIDRAINNTSYDFSFNSPIYKTTNETISHKEYVDAIKNRERVLSIIGSGDHILNAVFLGSKDIIGIDISLFAKYFLPLKLAAIETLSKEEYLEYFYGNNYVPFSIKFYSLIRDKLDPNTRYFWDNLYNEYKFEKLYNSALFNDFNLNINRAVYNNPFLKDDNYKTMRDKLAKIKIELLEYNIFDIKKLNKGNFDLIVLSNMINHIDKLHQKDITVIEHNKKFNKAIKEYKTFLHKLPLNIDGQAVTYNLTFYPKIKDLFKGSEYKVYTVNEEVRPYDLESEILVYKKIHKI